MKYIWIKLVKNIIPLLNVYQNWILKNVCRIGDNQFMLFFIMSTKYRFWNKKLGILKSTKSKLQFFKYWYFLKALVSELERTIFVIFDIQNSVFSKCTKCSQVVDCAIFLLNNVKESLHSRFGVIQMFVAFQIGCFSNVRI